MFLLTDSLSARAQERLYTNHVLHFILLLQFINCTPQYQQNSIQSLTMYTLLFHLEFLNDKGIERGKKKKKGAWLKVEMVSRFSGL